jgi:hypothetical protein
MRLTSFWLIMTSSISMLSCGVEAPHQVGETLSAVTGDTGTRCITAADSVVSSSAPPTVTVIASIASPVLPSVSCGENGDFAYKAVVYTNGDASEVQCLTAGRVQELKATDDGTLTPEILATLPATVAQIITCPP